MCFANIPVSPSDKHATQNTNKSLSKSKLNIHSQLPFLDTAKSIILCSLVNTKSRNGPIEFSGSQRAEAYNYFYFVLKNGERKIITPSLKTH